MAGGHSQHGDLRPSGQADADLSCKVDGHLNRSIDVALAVDGGEDDLVADVHERRQWPPFGPPAG
jgi:hypothetical protein